MKNKITVFIFFISFGFAFLACEKDEKIDTAWKDANEAAFNKISSASGYSKIESESKNGYITYKSLKSGAGKSPIFTDKVKVLYTGWYQKDWNNPETKVIFDTTDATNIPRQMLVSGNVNKGGSLDGFSTALQNMKVGDKWEVWIPWKLGYGMVGERVIPGYTTLVFEMELVAIL